MFDNIYCHNMQFIVDYALNSTEQENWPSWNIFGCLWRINICLYGVVGMSLSFLFQNLIWALKLKTFFFFLRKDMGNKPCGPPMIM